MAALRHGFEEPGDVQDIRLVVDTIPTLAWSAGADGSAQFLNQRWLDYTGLSAKQALGWGWQVAIHPDDLPRILETYREALNSAKPFEVEGRLRRFDGEFLQQLTNHGINDVAVPNSKERTVGLGPGIQLGGRGIWFRVNSYIETDVRNRPSGIKVVFRISKALPTGDSRP
jgi:PAS domain S-box-containing protein